MRHGIPGPRPRRAPPLSMGGQQPLPLAKGRDAVQPASLPGGQAALAPGRGHGRGHEGGLRRRHRLPSPSHAPWPLPSSPGMVATDLLLRYADNPRSSEQPLSCQAPPMRNAAAAACRSRAAAALCSILQRAVPACTRAAVWLGCTWPPYKRPAGCRHRPGDAAELPGSHRFLKQPPPWPMPACSPLHQHPGRGPRRRRQVAGAAPEVRGPLPSRGWQPWRRTHCCCCGHRACDAPTQQHQKAPPPPALPAGASAGADATFASSPWGACCGDLPRLAGGAGDLSPRARQRATSGWQAKMHGSRSLHPPHHFASVPCRSRSSRGGSLHWCPHCLRPAAPPKNAGTGIATHVVHHILQACL